MQGEEFLVESLVNWLFYNLLTMAYTYFLQQSFEKDTTTGANFYWAGLFLPYAGNRNLLFNILFNSYTCIYIDQVHSTIPSRSSPPLHFLQFHIALFFFFLFCPEISADVCYSSHEGCSSREQGLTHQSPTQALRLSQPCLPSSHCNFPSRIL